MTTEERTKWTMWKITTKIIKLHDSLLPCYKQWQQNVLYDNIKTWLGHFQIHIWVTQCASSCFLWKCIASSWVCWFNIQVISLLVIRPSSVTSDVQSLIFYCGLSIDSYIITSYLMSLYDKIPSAVQRAAFFI